MGEQKQSSLAKKVLVLNRVWQPVNIVSARRSFGLILSDSAQVVLADSQDFRIMSGMDWVRHSVEHPPGEKEAVVYTPSYRIRIPSVLLLNDYAKVPAKEPRLCRENIFKRDGYRCQYTGKVLPPEQLNIDHVIPKSHGGRSTWENLVTSSIRCNQAKANRLPHEAGLQLIKKPERPKWRVFNLDVQEHEVDATWRYFVAK